MGHRFHDDVPRAFEPDDVNRLIDNLVGEAQLPESVRKRIIEAAEGNPLYVEEILRMLMDDGILEKEGDQWVPTQDLSDFAIPPTIHALVAARLDKLGTNEQAVTQRGIGDRQDVLVGGGV